MRTLGALAILPIAALFLAFILVFVVGSVAFMGAIIVGILAATF